MKYMIALSLMLLLSTGTDGYWKWVWKPAKSLLGDLRTVHQENHPEYERLMSRMKSAIARRQGDAVAEDILDRVHHTVTKEEGDWFDGASFDRGDHKIVSMVNDILTDIISDINEEKML